mmetsp:Transcript_58/g.276  ORF Transcript_58/g.276 Transcript_58/m.276 type:complete len:332 (-) Transcript_58:216-1211(-)
MTGMPPIPNQGQSLPRRGASGALRLATNMSSACHLEPSHMALVSGAALQTSVGDTVNFTYESDAPVDPRSRARPSVPSAACSALSRGPSSLSNTGAAPSSSHAPRASQRRAAILTEHRLDTFVSIALSSTPPLAKDARNSPSFSVCASADATPSTSPKNPPFASTTSAFVASTAYTWIITIGNPSSDTRHAPPPWRLGRYAMSPCVANRPGLFAGLFAGFLGMFHGWSSSTTSNRRGFRISSRFASDASRALSRRASPRACAMRLDRASRSRWLAGLTTGHRAGPGGQMACAPWSMNARSRSFSPAGGGALSPSSPRNSSVPARDAKHVMS